MTRALSGRGQDIVPETAPNKPLHLTSAPRSLRSLGPSQVNGSVRRIYAEI